MATKSYDNLIKYGFDLQNYSILQKCVLLQILIFNRRRVGETSRMTVALFLVRDSVDRSQYQYTNRLEIMLAKHYQRMEILGKRERRLPVLLNLTQIIYLNLLLKYRVNFGVSEDNQFLFGTPSKLEHLDASVVIRQFSKQCGAKNPTSLRVGDVDVKKYKGKSMAELEVIVPQTNYENDHDSDLEINNAEPETYVADEHLTHYELEVQNVQDNELEEHPTQSTFEVENIKDKDGRQSTSKKLRTKLTWTPV
ncbi:hypothetical protein RN001_003684 [Aquatica leii]|uniref:Uncharacterized protein n=1 Tax=Aquatica leii TaxID=1421715 RepID=A0AAN7SRP1_9COLE|nr:hypothetical protein RN001_003684 [Aquatica leii]